MFDNIETATCVDCGLCLQRCALEAVKAAFVRSEKE